MTYPKDTKSLLQQLSGNFSAEGKRSCRDCLRSKAMPSELVIEVIEKTEISQAVLIKDHSTLMQRLETMSEDREITTLSRMNNMATVIRFVQLLLYMPSTSNQRHPLASQSSNSQTKDCLSSDRLDQLVHSLLMAIVNSVSTLLANSEPKQCDSDPITMDASTNFSDVRPLACFCFLSILRLQQFCKRKQQWMIPLARSLCDLASVSQKSSVPLPASLIEDAIRNMTKLLEEGAMILSNHAASDRHILSLDQHTFFAKFLSFLVTRILNLVQHLPRNGTEKVTSITPLWKILVTLRGLPFVLVVSTNSVDCDEAKGCSFLQNYTSIATKIEKQVLKIIWSESNETEETSHIHLDLLHVLLGMRCKLAKTPTSGDAIQELLTNSRTIGRLLLLHGFLQKLASDSTCPFSIEDCDAILQLCETYHSTVVPQCFGLLAAHTFGNSCGTKSLSVHPLSLDSTISSMVILLLRIEHSLALVDPCKRSQFHRLLIRWMTPTQNAKVNVPSESVEQGGIMHPMSQEFVLSVIYLLIVSSGTPIPPLLGLMVKLLFDGRTTTELRVNISIVFVRLQISAKRCNWNSAFAMQIENEFVEHWKEFSSSISHRRIPRHKRKRRDKDRNRIAIKAYSFADIEAIGHVLSRLQTSKSPLLQDAVRVFVEEKPLTRIEGKNVGLQLKSIALLLWYMQMKILGNHSPRFANDNLPSMLRHVLEYLTAQLHSTSTEMCLLQNLPLYMAALSLCQSMCGSATSALWVPLLSLSKFVAACISNSFLRMTSHETSRDSKYSTHINHHILLGAISLLGSMAQAIPSSSPPQVLETIRDTFVRIFEIQDMYVLGLALSALVRFGHAIATPHAQLLPTFLPKDRIPSFQARGQGMIWKNSQHCEIDDSSNSFLNLGSKLEHYIQQRHLIKSIFPTLSSYHIATGSYFLQMPTQGGRQALVIFPPGEQSLKDIRHMYELQAEEELPQVQYLKRVIVSGMGHDGFKCLLSQVGEAST